MKQYGCVTALVTMALANAVGVRAESVAVTQYNWLQLRPEAVATAIGGMPGGGSGYGTPDYFRWGAHVWIPNGTLTGNGTASYWAAVVLDNPRHVGNVYVQWWAAEGTAVSNYTIECSNDGTNWTAIGTWNNGQMKTGQRFRDNVDVADTVCRYIRVRLDAGGYLYGSANRGGPGLFAIEPVGTGVVSAADVNWAHSASFGTTPANNGLAFNGLRYNDGYLFDDEAVRTGNSPGNWDAGDYAQIDLKDRRRFDAVVAVWDYGWAGTNFTVAYSADGVDYQTVQTVTSTVQRGGPYGATEVRFAPVLGRYVRVQNVKTPASYGLLNQVLVYGSETPSENLVTVPGADGGGVSNDFWIARTETQVEHYLGFLNDLAAAEYFVTNGSVRWAATGDLLCLTTAAEPKAYVAYDLGAALGARFAAVSNRATHPMIYVTWYGAAAYCNWKSANDGLAAVYSATNGWSADLGQNGYRLPTENDWRKAAAWAAGQWLAYGTGSNALAAGSANYLNSGDAFEGQPVRTCPVGSYAASSPYGLKDASGNAWEWCQDGYEGPVTNAAAARAARGGGWGNLPQDLQTTVRSGFKPGQALDSVGLRILSGAAAAE